MLALGNRTPSAARLRALDGFLAGAWEDRMRHDPRLHELAVEAQFEGGVAHVRGSVERPEQLRLVRAQLGQLAGVLGVWSRVAVAGREPVVVDLGCGATKQYASNLGLDLRPAPGVDAVADLSRTLPLATGSVDVVFAVHLLEHLADFLPLVDEVHRVLRPGGVLHVMSPWWGHVNAVADPTHVRLLDVQTIKGICRRGFGDPRWLPLHVGCDGASVLADLMPLQDGEPGPGEEHLGRFFD
ncbi:MAG TPA: class I SAM-dependent methyltransferase [Candidatus Nanopelagicales bacterium]